MSVKNSLEDVATHIVALHIANTKELYIALYECCDEGALALKEEVESTLCAEVWDAMKSDIINAAVAAVDWSAVLYSVYGE